MEESIGPARAPKRKRRSITFPAKVNRRGTAYYITVTKSFREMLDIQDGDVIDVTLTVPDDYEDRFVGASVRTGICPPAAARTWDTWRRV